MAMQACFGMPVDTTLLRQAPVDPPSARVRRSPCDANETPQDDRKPARDDCKLFVFEIQIQFFVCYKRLNYCLKNDDTSDIEEMYRLMATLQIILWTIVRISDL